MAQFAQFEDDEITQVYRRAAAQARVIVEDMVSDPDILNALQLDPADEDRPNLVEFLSRVMNLGTLLGIKSACGLRLHTSTWHNFKQGEGEDT